MWAIETKDRSPFMQKFMAQGEDGNSKPLCDRLYEQIEQEREKSPPRVTLGSIFYAFVMMLAESQAQGPEEGKDSFLRLRIGPNFQELCDIMAFYWNEFRLGGYLGRQSVEKFVLRFLNIAIDDGRVVATFSKEGTRIYRAGESRLNRREYYASLLTEEEIEGYREHPCPDPTYREDVDSMQLAVDSMQRVIEHIYR